MHSPAYIARVDALSKQIKKDGKGDVDIEKGKDKEVTTGDGLSNIFISTSM